MARHRGLGSLLPRHEEPGMEVTQTHRWGNPETPQTHTDNEALGADSLPSFYLWKLINQLALSIYRKLGVSGGQTVPSVQ